MGAGELSIVIMPMLTCGILERTSKLRSPLKPDGGSLKFLSTYPSNMKLNSVPHCLRGEGGGGAGAAGAGAAVGVCPAGGLSGGGVWATATPPIKTNPATSVAQCVFRMVLLQFEIGRRHEANLRARGRCGRSPPSLQID